MADMRTTFQAGDPDHLQIHAQIAAEYNRTTHNPWGTGGSSSTHLVASSFGLGLSADTSTDAAALQSFFDSLTLSFTQSGLVRGGIGVAGELPDGNWYGSQFGHTIVAPSGSTGGDIVLFGQGAGATILTAADRSPGGSNKWNGVRRGCLGTAANMTSAARGGADAAGYAHTGNVFTLQIAAPWWTGVPPTRANPLCAQFDPIYLQVASCGVLRWASFVCTMNNVAGDYTKVQYMAYAQDMAVDGCIPPAQTVYFPAALLHGIGFKGSQGHHLVIRHLALQSGSTTGTPLDGIGLRRCSNARVDGSVSISNFFDGETINGSPWPIAATGGVGQNTDHSKNKAAFLNNDFHVSLVENSAGGWIAGSPVVGSGADAGIAGSIGGGRDDNWDEANFGSCTYSHFRIADGGSIETGNFDKVNFKSGHSVVKGEGVRGVQCKEPNMVDGLEGWFKVESAGNWVFDDESKTRTIWQVESPKMRFEAGLAINGSGNPTNFTDQPYFLQDCTMTSSVMTAKIVTAFGGSTGKTGHGLGPGDAIQVGNAGPNYTLDTSMIGLPLPQANIKVTTSLSEAPTSGTFLVTAAFGQITVTYTGVNLVTNTFTGCTGGASRNVLLHATGTNPQTGQLNVDVAVNVFNGESRIASIAADGCTITAPFPQYTGGDSGGAGTTATMGTIGFMRCGTFGRFDFTADWDLAGVDRYVQAGQYFDLSSLNSGTLRINRNYLSSGPRKKLPTFRIRDAETVKSTHGTLLASYTDSGGTVYTNVLQDLTVQFHASDVGATVSCTNVAGGSDTIAAFIDVDHVKMSGAVTASTAQTWNLRPTAVLDDFGMRIELGNLSFACSAHAGSVANPDANAIAAGSAVELTATDAGNIGIQCSVCSQVNRFVGIAMQGSQADASVSVDTTGTGTTALIRLLTPSPLVLTVPGGVNNGDLVQMIGSAAVAVGYLVDDGATHPGKVKAAALTGGVPNAGQRIIGYTPKSTGSAGNVYGRVFSEQWT